MGALDFQGILEEMRLDGLEELSDEQHIRDLIDRRQNYLDETHTEVQKVKNNFRNSAIFEKCLSLKVV